MFRQYLLDNEKRSILLSSHISSDLEGLCDDIYLIHDGKIVLHEDTDTILSNYAVLKIDDDTYEKLDKSYILGTKKEHFGYACFTSEKQFYAENYQGIVIEKGNIDDLIDSIADDLVQGVDADTGTGRIDHDHIRLVLDR